MAQGPAYQGGAGETGLNIQVDESYKIAIQIKIICYLAY